MPIREAQISCLDTGSLREIEQQTSRYNLDIDILRAPLVKIVDTQTDYLSHVMRKPDFCLCENKDADQLCSNCKARQHLCFRYSDSTIPFLLKSKISIF